MQTTNRYQDQDSGASQRDMEEGIYSSSTTVCLSISIVNFFVGYKLIVTLTCQGGG